MYKHHNLTVWRNSRNFSVDISFERLEKDLPYPVSDFDEFKDKISHQLMKSLLDYIACESKRAPLDIEQEDQNVSHIKFYVEILLSRGITNSQINHVFEITSPYAYDMCMTAGVYLNVLELAYYAIEPSNPLMDVLDSLLDDKFMPTLEHRRYMENGSSGCGLQGSKSKARYLLFDELLTRYSRRMYGRICRQLLP